MSMATQEPPPHPVLLAPPDISRWREGNTGVPYVHAIDSGRPGPDVLVTALVHGNEYSGAIVLADLLAAGLAPRRGRLTLAFCNVAAFERFEAEVAPRLAAPEVIVAPVPGLRRPDRDTLRPRRVNHLLTHHPGAPAGARRVGHRRRGGRMADRRGGRGPVGRHAAGRHDRQGGRRGPRARIRA